MIALEWSTPVLREPELFAKTVRGALDGVVLLNQATLRAYPRIRPLYQSGIPYDREPTGTETIRDIVEVIKRGWGDCAHLAAWRCAELLNAGEKANLRIVWQVHPSGKRRIFHVLVRRGNGTVEGPSEYCGMRPWRHPKYKPDEPQKALAAPIWAKDVALWQKAKQRLIASGRQFVQPNAALAKLYQRLGGRIG